MTGTLYVIAAPSGAGKTTLVKALSETLSDVQVSISHTTRPKRPDEKEGVNYHFITDATFNKMLVDGLFLEHAKVFDYQYGTSKAWVQTQLDAGKDVILEIDWQGAAQVKQLFPASVGIFIVPPSLEVLKHRLQDRAQDHAEVIDKRLAEASHEISHCNEFDFIVINEEFDVALADLSAIFKSFRLRTTVQRQQLQQLLAELVS